MSNNLTYHDVGTDQEVVTKISDNGAITTKEGNIVSSQSVTPNDDTDLTGIDCIYVGSGGDVALKFSGNTNAQTWKNVPAGTIISGEIIRVMSTNTTASNILGLTYG